jgi:hypothetical protein
MAGSCAGVFPPWTDRMAESGIIRGSNRTFWLSIKKIRSVVSIMSYAKASATTRFVVRTMVSPLFRYGLPMQYISSHLFLSCDVICFLGAGLIHGVVSRQAGQFSP